MFARLPRPLLACSLAALVGCQRERPEAPPGPTRELVELREGWRFRAGDEPSGGESEGLDERGFAAVSVPHTWAKTDPRTYKAAWYRTRFKLSPADAGRRVYLLFEGVAAIADVYENGVHLGQHRGAYTRFVFDATPHARPGENLLAVRVSNDAEETADCLPSGQGRQLYHVWGGVHRKAWLLKTDALHVDPADLASPGVYVTPSNVTEASADLGVRVRVRNASTSARRFEVRGVVADAEGRPVLQLREGGELAAGAGGVVSLSGRVARPRLWSPSDPYLHTVRAELVADGRVVDAVSQRTGFRDFRMDPSGGFVLNGKPILLRGTNKHQQTERGLSALSDDEIRQDFELLKELGANTVRLAHYPHSELAYSLADEKGILVIAENGHSNPHPASEAGERITREMVRQLGNHPSIVAWSVGNEANYLGVFRYARIAREADPLRLITYASNIGVVKKLRDLSFVAQNTYRGWYRARPWEFEAKAREMRYVMEAGAGSVVTHHTDYAEARKEVDEFEPEEYRQEIAEVHSQVVFRDRAPEIPLYLSWVFRDFATEKYKGVLNTKGLLTPGNLRKDVFYLHQSHLRPELPVVHITSQTYFLRRGRADNGIKAYSNRPKLTLTVNGGRQAERPNGLYRHGNGRVIDNVFFWDAALRPGRNEIVAADAEGHSDRAVVHYASPGGRVPEAADALVRGLRSSNPRNPAYFIDAPAREQWPFYYEFDGSADNTFDRLPPPLEGARWIATRRLSQPENRTELSFELTSDAVVSVLATDDGRRVQELAAAGFAEAGSAEWRDNDLRLVPARLHQRPCRRGERVRLPALARDYVVLVKPRP